MPFLDQQTQQDVRAILEPVQNPVELVLYTGGPLVIPGRDAPGLQDETRQLLQEIVALNDKLSLEERPIAGDEDARAAGIELAPTVVIREAGSARTNIRFAGLPSGYEFRTLLDAILIIGTGDTDLGERSRAELQRLDTPARLQVFVTPTCPYCPRAVLTAFKLAYHNPNVIAEGVEANEFPQLSTANRISGVPDTIITAARTERVLGGQPERAFVEAVMKAAASA